MADETYSNRHKRITVRRGRRDRSRASTAASTRKIDTPQRIDLSKSPPDTSLLRLENLSEYLHQRTIPYRRIGAGISVVTCNQKIRPSAFRALTAFQPVLEVFTCSAKDFDDTIRQIFSAELTRRAVDHLFEANPELSARRPISRGLSIFVLSLVILVSVGCLMRPDLIATGLVSLLLIYVLASAILKLILILAGFRKNNSPPPPNTDHMPVVTLFVPMFRETRTIGTLTSAISNIDYPKSKLDVKYLVEEDDIETQTAIGSIDLPGFIDVIPVPYSQPRTKPKAMNYALPLARGELVGIFDAEDIPDPKQIRKAVAALDSASPETVCVQARLNHYNATDSLVSRGASMEYALWFDLFLTGLGALRLPVPLGGTSLYIKTDALREVGGWDPDNVTEDADLGVRLARRGWRATLIDSTTLEEAPEGLRLWIAQRSRWIKGFIVTWIVHMRRPRQLFSDLGWRGGIAINLMLLDGFAAFLAQPFFIAMLLYWIVSLLISVPVLLPPSLISASFIVFPLGQAVVLIAAWLAVRRRFGQRQALWTPWLWLYWQFGCIAAIRALWEVFSDPHSWAKTEHGIGRNVVLRSSAVLQSAKTPCVRDMTHSEPAHVSNA